MLHHMQVDAGWLLPHLNRRCNGPLKSLFFASCDFPALSPCHLWPPSHFFSGEVDACRKRSFFLFQSS